MGSVPPLVVRFEGSDRSLPAGPAYLVGRDPQAAVVAGDTRVSWHHAVLRLEGSRWVLADNGSTNGIYTGGQRVDRIEIDGDCLVRLGHPADGPLLACSVLPGARHAAAGQPAAPVAVKPSAAGQSTQGRTPLPPPREPSAVRDLPATVLRIGRAAGSDIVVDDMSVSRHHAELRHVDGGYQIADLGSFNGTFVNGQRVILAPLAEGDLVGIGSTTFRLTGRELQEFAATGDVSLVARDLTVRVPGGKVLLDRVSFPLGERCLLGIIGPSGAGKSTLLGALTGMRPAGEGSVLYDNRDLYADYAELRHRIGLVPQEDILHAELTPRRALKYAAELRFPNDTSKAEREHRADEVLGELSLTAHADTRTSKLSGGQRKRVNVALELMTKPSLLFLDEPTSGLDPGLDKSLMQMLSGLAHDGRTVVVVTHSVDNLGICDRLLVLAPGGRVAYFGPPADGLRHFGKASWAEVFQAINDEPGRDWAGDFQRSPWQAQYVAAGLDGQGPSAGQRQAPPAPPSRNRLAQFSTLSRRYLSVIASDRVYLAMLIGAPFVLGAFARAIPARNGLAPGPATPGQHAGSMAPAASVLLLLAFGACFAGAFISIRELVKERAIYSRERATGLSPASYLFSKLVVLALFSGFQAAVIVVLGLLGRKLPATGSLLTSFPLAEMVAAIAVLAVVSMVLGLLVSASVSTSERTMPLLMVFAVVEVVFCGGLFPIGGKAGVEEISWLSPSRWGFAGTASTASLNKLIPAAPGSTGDALWRHSAHTWLLDMGALTALGVVFAVLAWRQLARQGPRRKAA